MTKTFKGYDLIGDVHGCAISLCILLDRLGYQEIDGVYQHPERQAVFIGDIIDRGPYIREALHIVRRMVDAGAARIVMGNHEYNLVCFMTPRPDGKGHLRPHTERNQRIVRETLEQFAAYPDELQEFLDWMLHLPLFIETDRFRAVHACWHQQTIDHFVSLYGGNTIDKEFLLKTADPDSFEYDLLDILLRGTHLPLPNGEEIVSSDGFRRRFFRTKFWEVDPQTHGDVVFQPDPLPEHIAVRPLTDGEIRELVHYSPDEKLLFIGHYWCEGKPHPIAPNIACIDYSAVKYGKLVAYRLDDETRLKPEKFVWVDVGREVRQPDQAIED